MHARYLAYAGFFAVGTYFLCGSQLKATCSLTVVALYARGAGTTGATKEKDMHYE